ncbi:MAG: FAD-dependent oxidoreductase [Clostridiales bacterium]|nr:FAD-dependent oxidoreductase [Clostridiales bacterium]
MEEKTSICVIGAGLSGLVCAYRLAVAGFRVQVVEQQSTPGGMLGCSRLGSEYIELLPHHIRRSDRALLALLKELGLSDELQWYDTLWYGRASKKKLGYLDNGFHSLLAALVQEITDHGGIIQYGYTVSEIAESGNPDKPKYRVQCVLADSTSIILECDTILYTGSCRNLVHITHDLNMPTDFRDSLMDVTYQANMCLMLVMKTPFTECYSRQVPDDEPFQRIIQHTSMVGQRRYGGHVLYLSGNYQTSSPLWTVTDAEVFKIFFKRLQYMNPSVTRNSVRTWRLKRTRYAKPLNHPLDEFIQPVTGLYVCSLAMTTSSAEDSKYRMDACVTQANATVAKIKEDFSREKEPEIEPQ